MESNFNSDLKGNTNLKKFEFYSMTKIVSVSQYLCLIMLKCKYFWLCPWDSAHALFWLAVICDWFGLSWMCLIYKAWLLVKKKKAKTTTASSNEFVEKYKGFTNMLWISWVLWHSQTLTSVACWLKVICCCFANLLPFYLLKSHDLSAKLAL